MASLSDLGFTLRTFLKAYRWRRINPVPAARLTKPLAECRVALVTSAGLVTPGNEPFDDKVKGGDWSYRVIPGDVDVQSLAEHHRSDSFDHGGIDADRNMALPLDRLRELADDGGVGEVAPRHVSLMGSITAPGRFMKHTVPEGAIPPHNTSDSRRRAGSSCYAVACHLITSGSRKRPGLLSLLLSTTSRQWQVPKIAYYVARSRCIISTTTSTLAGNLR